MAVDKALMDALTEQTGVRVHAIHQPREQRRAWLDMAQRTPTCNWHACWRKRARNRPVRVRLGRGIGLAARDLDQLTIECFDISHTAGEATQASCVVFHHHKMQSSEYRRYKIEGITGGDDYAAMRQVLTRRYSKVVEAQREEGGIDFAAAGPMAQRHSAKGPRACRPGAHRRWQGPGGCGP